MTHSAHPEHNSGTPTTCYTLDEARTAFCASARQLIETVTATDRQLARLLAGAGNLSPLDTRQQLVVHQHRALLAQLELAGHARAIHAELEGILACIQLEGITATASILRAS